MSDVINPSNPAPVVQSAEAVQGTQPGSTATQAGVPASTGNVAKDAAAEAMRKFKVKVDGQEIEVDEQELRRGYAHQKAASKALNEGKALRKQAEQLVSMMKDQGQLFDVIKKMGHDPRKLAEEFLANQLQDELMDPRDKELRDTKARLKQIEDMENMQKEALQKQHIEKLKSKFTEDYSKQFTEALDQSGLPKTKVTVAEMAKYIARAADMNFKMTAAEAAQLVKEDLQSVHRSLIGDSDGEALIRLLGEEVANKVRKWDTSRVKTPEQHLQTPMEQGEPSNRSKSSGKRMSAKEWREFNRKK